jgi:hypothetical protein
LTVGDPITYTVNPTIRRHVFAPERAARASAADRAARSAAGSATGRQEDDRRQVTGGGVDRAGTGFIGLLSTPEHASHNRK